MDRQAHFGLRRGAAVLLALVASCQDAGTGDESQAQTRTLFVLLVDKSRSVEDDQLLYRSMADRVVGEMRQGDRIVMAPITATSGTDFRTMREHSLPDPIGSPGLMDEPIPFRQKQEEHSRILESTKSAIESDIEELMSFESTADHTAIFEALRTTAPLFAGEQARRKVLVLLSDMVEDSEVADFERRVVTREFTEDELERQRAAEILPDLQGVTVCVGGVLASPPVQAAALERFWMAYFAATEATITASHYARVLTSCPD